MRKRFFYDESRHYATLQYVKKAVQALCLATMVAAFVSLGAIAYQGWKLFHNPYRVPQRIAQAPSPEAALWAAEVYRIEKENHLLYTGMVEVGLVILSAGSWFAYRRLDRHLQALHRLKRSELEKAGEFPAAVHSQSPP